MSPTLKERHDALARFVRRQMKDLNVPGVAIGLRYRGRDHTQGFGVTNIEHPLPVTPETLFWIGSTTKTFTATAIMMLAEQSKLDLDHPVRRYLKDFRMSDSVVERKATVRHLLIHTGGWVGDFFADTGRGDDALEKVVAQVGTLPQLTPLGQTWSYNNASFYVAGRVIEAVTKKPYEQAVREMIFEPLGMTSTFFFPEELHGRRVAAGHLVSGGNTTVLKGWPLARSANAAGGIVSCAADQLVYARFHLGDGRSGKGKRLLSARSLAAMKEEQAKATVSPSAVGISWLLSDVQGVKVVGHGGTLPGQLSAFQMVPERDYAITVMTNSSTGAMLHRKVLKWSLSNLLGLTIPDPVPLDLPRSELSSYAGTYRHNSYELGLSLRGGILTMVYRPLPGSSYPRSLLPPPVPLRMFERDRFFVPEGIYEGARGEFLRAPSGEIEWLRFSSRIHAAVKEPKRASRKRTAKK